MQKIKDKSKKYKVKERIKKSDYFFKENKPHKKHAMLLVFLSLYLYLFSF
jgi:hypothetical protein